MFIQGVDAVKKMLISCVIMIILIISIVLMGLYQFSPSPEQIVKEFDPVYEVIADYQFQSLGTIEMIFPNRALAQAVADELAVNIDTYVTQSELNVVEELISESWWLIDSMVGIEYLENLTSLTLRSNQITDITPLGGLTNLRILRLNGNLIDDLRPLSNLRYLEELDLTFNEIDDLQPLSNLVNLEFLSLYGNEISDLGYLENLTQLEELSLGINQISDISPLENLTGLRRLDLISNQIEDITPLASVTVK